MFEKLDIKPEKENTILLTGIAYFGNFILPILAPIIIYLISKEDKYARFHAVQSLCILLFTHLPLVILFVILMATSVTWEQNTMFLFTISYAFVALIINLIFLIFGILAVLGKTIRVPYPFMTDFILRFV